MSVQMQIDRISTNISQTYSVLSDAGADIPETANSDNLPDTARSIKAVLYDRTQNLTDEQKAQARENIGAQPVGNYALKTEIPSVPVQSVNGKTGAVNLTASDVKARSDSWMPTAQDVGALPSTYTPPNQTAQQVGALAVSGGDMTGEIRMNGQPISGLNDPTEDTQAARKGYVDAAKAEANDYTDTAKSAANTYTDASVRKAAPRNLLDNSDFRNLVAQAGIGGNHGTIAYAADRWILDSGTVSYEAGVGLTLNGTIRQKLEFPPTGETSTFVGMESGTASISYADGAVTITSSGGVLKWAALYGGVYTETTKPEYQPKGYGAELAECQRYYVRFTDDFRGMGSISNNAKGLYPTIIIPSPMRIRPTCICSGSVTARDHKGYLTEATWSDPQQNVDVSLDSIFATSVVLNVEKSDGKAWSGVTNNTLVFVYFREGTILELSADL